MRLCQIALSVTDLRRTHRWYREVLGLASASGTNSFAGPIATMVQGVPRAASTCWWLVDRQDQFQVELFEFRSPLVRTLAPDWRPSDVGYSTVAFHVGDLDATLARAVAAGTRGLTSPLGEAGRRRACLRDPEGVLVELMEEDPREPGRAAWRELIPEARDVLEGVSVVGDVLGLEEATGIELHRPEHEALWGLDSAESKRAVLWAGDFLVELVQYAEPSPRPRPEGYRISDQGLLNIALGFRERAEFDSAYSRCREGGLEPNGPPLRLGAWSVVYVNDDQGFSVELLHVQPWYERQMGFRPRATPRVAPFAGRTPARERHGRRFTKAIVTGAAGGIGAELCRLAAEDGTALELIDRDDVGLARLSQLLPDTATVTINSLLQEVGGAGELVQGVPLTLTFGGTDPDDFQSMVSRSRAQTREDIPNEAEDSIGIAKTLVKHPFSGQAAHPRVILDVRLEMPPSDELREDEPRVCVHGVRIQLRRKPLGHASGASGTNWPEQPGDERLY